MSNDYQLNQIRELLAEVDPKSEIAVKIKEVIDSNPIDKLVKKWESKLKPIKDEQEKKAVAVLLENAYLHFKEKETGIRDETKRMHKKNVKELEDKLQDANAIGTADDSIISILVGQLDLLKKQEPNSPPTQEDEFCWRHVNPYDEVLKLWDCLSSARSVFGFQSMSQPASLAYALRFIKNPRKTTNDMQMSEINLTISQKAFQAESINTKLDFNQKVSGEQLAKNLENELFKRLYEFLKEKQKPLAYPLSDRALFSNIEKIATNTKCGPANFIIANESFFEEHDRDWGQLYCIKSNAIPPQHYIIGYKGKKESEAGIIVGLYQVLMQSMPLNTPQSFKPQSSFITRFGFCEDIEGAENYYMLCKIPKVVQRMVDESEAANKRSFKGIKDKYVENMDAIENGETRQNLNVKEKIQANIDEADGLKEDILTPGFTMDISADPKIAREAIERKKKENNAFETPPLNRTPEEQAKINKIAEEHVKYQKECEKREKKVQKEKMECLHKELDEIKDRPIKVCKELFEWLSTGAIDFDQHKELFKEYLPDHFEVGKYTTGEILP
jgi:hypothetical protein